MVTQHTYASFLLASFIAFAHSASDVLAAASLDAASLTPAQELHTCLAETNVPSAITYEDFLQGKPNRLLLHDVWHSPKSPSLDIALTLFTGVTASRLGQLKAQCQHWPGRLSAALYVPVKAAPGEEGDADMSELIAAGAAVQELLQEVEAEKHSCALDLMLLYELIVDDAMMGILPVNTLRNYAAMQARTELVAMFDVDLLPSLTLAAFLNKPDNIQLLQQMCRDKAVVVVPAFMTAVQWKHLDEAHELASEVAAAESKTALRSMVNQGLAYQFHVTHFRYGHGCTNYAKWFKSDKPYSVRHCWTALYEPWFIVNRKQSLPYDAVFRGYGWNKITHVANLYHQGFDFQVIPDGFVVHRQHESSPISSKYHASLLEDRQTNTSVNAVTTKFKNQVMKALREQAYSPAVDATYASCLNQLSWWR